MRSPNEHLQFSVYRKPTNTNRYLDAESYHPFSHKKTTAITLLNRANTLCSEEYKSSEIDNVSKILQINGFNKNMIKSTMKTGIGNRRHSPNEPKSYKYISAPYIKGSSERVNKLLEKYGYRLGHKPNHTLASMVSKTKDKRTTLEKCGVVYKINCYDCDKVYIGETGKELTKRIQEHKNSVHRRDHLSAIYHHIEDTGHHINWDNPTILAQQDSPNKRRVLESIFSQKESSSINRSIELPTIYSSTVKRILES